MTPETDRPIPSEVAMLAQAAPGFLENVRVVQNGEDMNLALHELKEIKASLATFKPARDEFLRPAREALRAYEKRFDDAAAPVITKLNLAKSGWETAILTYNAAERARAQRARLRCCLQPRRRSRPQPSGRASVACVRP